jgi:PPK2 family polyphosphate:nucleotide phosphotransferase
MPTPKPSAWPCVRQRSASAPYRAGHALTGRSPRTVFRSEQKEEMMKRGDAGQFVKPLRVEDGDHFRLAKIDPNDTLGVDIDKEKAKDLLGNGIEVLKDLQEKLYAQDSWAVLAIFQAMDAAGKDSAIKHVMSGINPQGCQVYSFKAPSSEELDHDFMWRCLKKLPERGRIGIFNRSYYEEVLVVRVHQEYLKRQHLPAELVSNRIWENRFEDIRAIERYLVRNGIVVVKFFLHISKQEQRKRFLARLDDPAKNWKFSSADVTERQHWDEYMAAYQDMIRNTATKYAPWHVVPADKKWFARLAVAATLIDALERLDLRFPDPPDPKELKAARAQLMKEENAARRSKKAD